MTTYCDTVTSATVAADTETRVGGANITILPGQTYTIKKVLYGYGSVVDAKGATGTLELKIDKVNGPFKFPVGHGNGGATSTPPGPHCEIDVDIQVPGSANVGIYITLADAAVECNAGIMYVG